MLSRIIGGLGLCLVLSLFSFTHANAFGIYGPQPDGSVGDDYDKYYYWGDEAGIEPKYVRNGIDIAVDGSSTSFQSIKATITMDANLIEDRDISHFVILANGIYVDFFNAYFDNSLTPPRYLEYYGVDIDVTSKFIGSELYFQVLGIHTNPDDTQYVVAWSYQSPNYVFKPLPVIDRGAIGVLNSILSKLQELKNSLEGKLDKVTKAVEDIYTASPEQQNRLDNAMQSFMDALPMKQLEDQAEAIQDKMEEKRQALKDPANETSELKFGEFEWWPGDPDTRIAILDLTEWKEQVILFRNFIKFCLWAWFFQMLFAMLSPKLNI